MKYRGCNCITSCISIFILLIILGVVLALSYFNIVFRHADKVETSNNNVSSVDSIRTPKLRIVLVSDTESDWPTFEKFIKVSKTYKPDVIIHMGDIAKLGVLPDLQKSHDLFKDYPVPVYFVPGDRDLWKSNGTKNFNEVFGNDYQYIDIKGVKLLFVDNADEYRGIDLKQMAFIKEKISVSDFIFLHNPIEFNGDSIMGMMKKGMGEYSEAVDKQRIELVDLIRDSNVKATFSGDQHFYSVLQDPVKPSLFCYVVGALTSERNLEQPNFAVLNIYDDMTFKVEQVLLED